MIDDRPVRGYGPDQFLYAYLPRYVQPTAWGERFTAHAHNFLLDFWIRLGIIGAAFVGFVVLMCLLALARRLRGPWRSQPLGMAAVVALIAIFANGLVDNAFFAHDLAMSCWLLAWLAFGANSDVAGAEGGVEIARAGVGRGWLYRLTPLR
jgi:O-antigen ligase